MRWQTVVAALALGMIGGAGWVLWEQRQETHAAVAAAPPPRTPEPVTGDIPLKVQQDRGALRLRWSTNGAAIRDADHGTLTITDNGHESSLKLDANELRSGLASWWPEGSHVAFRLETDTGASSSIEADTGIAAKPKPERAAAAKTVTAAKVVTPARRRARVVTTSSHAPIDDGLEWTQQPRRESRWSRLKKKIPFWRRASSDE